MEVAGTRVHMRVGHAYKVNTLKIHHIQNGGQTPRVHLMFDVRSKRK
jgi:hypothetical protein